jgi:hypothetical protein
VLRHFLGKRSKSEIIHSRLGVKSWERGPPSPEAVRPSGCPACGAASRPPGRRLNLVGHGLRDRQLRGPPAVGSPPAVAVVRVRLYLCVECGAVMTVVPREVVARRHFSAPAIGLAMALFGVAEFAAHEVRRRVSPWSVVGPTAAAGWLTLRRWLRAARRGELFAAVRPAPPGFSSRQVAARVATTLAASALPHTAKIFDEQVFAGACAMA